MKQKLRELDILDIRLVVLIGLAGIALSVFWSGAKIIQTNYDLSLKVEAISKENEIIELQNRNKELQNQYYATDTYAELTARRVFGKALPGETVYIVPQDVALNALDNPISDDDQQLVLPPTEKPAYQRNLESWLRIYLGE